MIKVSKPIILILPCIGGLLLATSPFLPWAYGGFSKEPYSVWSALVRVPDNPVYWVWLALTGISGLLIIVLSICAILVRGYLSQRFWLFNLGIAIISFFYHLVSVVLTAFWEEPPYAATLGIGALAALFGPAIAVLGLLLIRKSYQTGLVTERGC